MQEKEIKPLFEAGAIRKATIADAPLTQGEFIAQFELKKDGKWTPSYITTKRENSNAPKQFKTIDAAVKQLYRIGLRQFSVTLK